MSGMLRLVKGEVYSASCVKNVFLFNYAPIKFKKIKKVLLLKKKKTKTKQKKTTQ